MNQPSTPEPATSSNSSSGTEPSGADLARLAFRQARQDAKAHGNQTRAPRRRPAPGKREGRDPAGLSTVVAGLLAERAWDLGVSGGSILDRWPDIAAAVSPQLPHHVTAVAYHPETRQLDLRPDSPAYGMQLGLITPQIIAAANRPAGDGAAQDGGGPVRTIRVLPFGASPPSPAARTSPPATARPAADVPTQPRKPPSAGYQSALAAHQEYRANRPTTAIQQRTRAAVEAHTDGLRRHREPEEVHLAAYGATEDPVDDDAVAREQSWQAARRRARADKASRTTTPNARGCQELPVPRRAG
ncbi:DciA family protein (plasmid) [Streptomyces sp. NBC_01525]|uniref:DUF721 domain-containing protein n=1 Tax=Streptomyces sp. NBC_01525 TaxID=2903893 RepID=UPI002F90E0FC